MDIKELNNIYDKADIHAKNLLMEVENGKYDYSQLLLTCSLCISCIGISYKVEKNKLLGTILGVWEEIEERFPND